MKIPYVNLAEQHAAIKDKLLAAVSKVLDHGRFILGEEVEAFEKRFAQLGGVPYALGVNSGTDALILALRALNIGPGDEVITVANSFVSSASCIVSVGARPVFVDVRDDLMMDPSLIVKAIGTKTKAILPVHWTGCPADMAPIMELAEKYNLFVIEDCAQAVNAQYKGQKVGSFGDVGCFSLHPLKTLNACGDGGVLTMHNGELYQKLRALRDNGFSARYECIYWSNNSRLDTLQAAMLLVKLDYLEEWTQKRQNNARFYQNRLAKLPQLCLPVDEPGIGAVYHTFIIQAEDRDELQSFLADRGIGTKIHYAVPIHQQPMAESLGYKRGSLPNTERQAKKVLSLPVYPELDEEMLEYVVNNICDFYKTRGYK